MPKVPSLSSAAGNVRASVFAELQHKIDERTARGGSLVPLQIGDTYLPPPEGSLLPHVAGVREHDADLYRYGPIAGLARLREAIAAELRRKGMSWVEPGRHVLVGCGATHSLFCAAKTVLEPGDEVLLFSPYWPLAPGVLSSCGARPVEVPVSQRLYANPSLDAADLLAEALTPRTTALYLITPNNPDGKVLSRRDLASIAAFAERHDLWIFADEVYADYPFAAPHVPIASLPGLDRRTITASSFSKSHALAGARVGFIAAPEPVIAAARRISTHTVYNVPLVSQRAAVAALEAGPGWIDDARREYLAARDFTAASLEGAGLSYGLAEGGAYLFLDFTELLGGRPPRVLLERAIEEGVLLAPGGAFGAAFERSARLCYTGVPRAELALGIARLRAAIDAIR
jgi:aspartate/methionine/tyrosine aminotransferase